MRKRLRQGNSDDFSLNVDEHDLDFGLEEFTDLITKQLEDEFGELDLGFDVSILKPTSADELVDLGVVAAIGFIEGASSQDGGPCVNGIMAMI